ALLASAHQAAQDFLPIEALAASVFLHHHVWHFVDALVGGEALATLQTLAATANGFAFLALARVHDFIFFKIAEWTFQSGANPTSESRDPSLRSGFRLRAPAALTPAKRLKVAHQGSRG